MRISEWSSDVCSSDLTVDERPMQAVRPEHILPATQTKCFGGALSDHACPAVDGLPAIEKTRHKDESDPALQNCGYAAQKERDRENDEIGCLELGDILLDEIRRATWRGRVWEYVET